LLSLASRHSASKALMSWCSRSGGGEVQKSGRHMGKGSHLP